MESLSSPAKAPERINIAPGGDVLVRLKDGKEMRVWSFVLQMASPVMKAKLSPTWNTTTMSTSRFNHEFEIMTLAEDDSKSMELLICIFHLQSALLPDTLKVAQLLKLAKVAEKYQCCNAIKFATELWLESAKPDFECREYNGDEEPSNFHVPDALSLLEAAYFLDNAKWFAKWSDELARAFEFPESALGKLRDVLPLAELPDMIETNSRKLHDYLKDRIYSLMGTISESLDSDLQHCVQISHRRRSGDFEAAKGTPECDSNDRAACLCFKALHCEGLLVPNREYMGLQRLLRAVQSIKVPTDESIVQCADFKCKAEDLLSAFSASVYDLRQKAAAGFAGACLDCFKAGGVSATNCRFKHPKWAITRPI